MKEIGFIVSQWKEDYTPASQWLKMTLIYCAAAVVSSDLNTLAKSQILKYTDKVSSFGEKTNKDCFSRKMYQHFQKRKSLRIIFVDFHKYL